MRNYRSIVPLQILVAAMLGMALSSLAGCNGAGREPLTPLAESAQYRQIYVTTLETLASLGEAGLLKREQIESIEPWREIVATALDDLELAAIRNEPQTYRNHLRRVSEALDRLIAARINAQAATSN